MTLVLEFFIGQRPGLAQLQDGEGSRYSLRVESWDAKFAYLWIVLSDVSRSQGDIFHLQIVFNIYEWYIRTSGYAKNLFYIGIEFNMISFIYYIFPSKVKRNYFSKMEGYYL